MGKITYWQVYKTEKGYTFENGEHRLALISLVGIWVIQGTPGIMFYPTLGEGVSHILYWMKLNTPNSRLDLDGIPELGETIRILREREKL
ncbi:MAG: hypothetical protein Q8O10_10260 [candidate division Zixibacteria bacterium]|nr:hypothetical protein [candidate division Zixibacteria bacterium]